MDSFKQIWGVAEGCSSSESGWTMYIDSPMQEDHDGRLSNENDGYNHNHNHHHEIYGEKNRRKKKVDEEESDDSMASDASSGPTNYHHQGYSRGQGSKGSSISKKDKQDHGSKSFSKKNGNNKEKKHVDSRRKK